MPSYEAQRNFIMERNLRLVVNVAKKFRNRGLPFEDLIQEGNDGLMRGVEKYDYRRGFKLSTYVTHWILQRIKRSLEEIGQEIRHPSHVVQTGRKANEAYWTILAETGQTPSTAEVAAYIGESEKVVVNAVKAPKASMSLDRPARGQYDDEAAVGSNFEAVTSDEALRSNAIEKAEEFLLTRLDALLNEREREVIIHRFCIGIPRSEQKTLEQVGAIFHVTRERIRQIQAAAIRKLQKDPELRAALASIYFEEQEMKKHAA